MKEPAFFAGVRSTLLGPTLSQSEVDGCKAILAAMAGAPLSHVAYALATAYLETAHSMQPIEEMGGDAYFFRRYDPHGQRPDIARRLGNSQPDDGALYCGRGYVQLTGRANYAKAAAKLGTDLVRMPGLAMQPDFAARIMRQGMTEGWFTGKRFASYLPATGPAVRAQFLPARRIINGQDRAGDVADYALHFQAALLAGGMA